ncbi:hypothetical protein [Chitinasiproducens palmae]|uniref:Uncharacterized protein n=1 Tax=Chitinasiproducens palmae TaxID=1770053 RepID=A0A1H2PS82_9BURK|nr:hypothetical protein [Chitinasiproducens palmae]SDV49784.1 hypothetical protein SAMN05216551_109132 [Chitinasiproducens palmae]
MIRHDTEDFRARISAAATALLARERQAVDVVAAPAPQLVSRVRRSAPRSALLFRLSLRGAA